MDAKKAIEYLYGVMEAGKIKNDYQQEVYEIAIEALGKQVARKIMYKNIPAYKYGSTTATCPSCEAIVEKPFAEDEYCSYCGQELDWEV